MESLLNALHTAGFVAHVHSLSRVAQKLSPPLQKPFRISELISRLTAVPHEDIAHDDIPHHDIPHDDHPHEDNVTETPIGTYGPDGEFIYEGEHIDHTDVHHGDRAHDDAPHHDRAHEDIGHEDSVD
jgi:hypothetical protein